MIQIKTAWHDDSDELMIIDLIKGHYRIALCQSSHKIE